MVKTPLPGVHFQSLVRELSPHAVWHGQKLKKKKKNLLFNLFSEVSSSVDKVTLTFVLAVLIFSAQVRTQPYVFA